jgi:hypothetical protein
MFGVHRAWHWREAIILHAPQARSEYEADSAFTPFAKLGGNVVCNESDIRRTPDKLVRFGIEVGRNKGKHSTTIRRSDSHVAAATSIANVADQAKSQLIKIESEALFLIANKDINGVDAEMRPLVWLEGVLIVARMHGRPLVGNDYKVLDGRRKTLPCAQVAGLA